MWDSSCGEIVGNSLNFKSEAVGHYTDEELKETVKEWVDKGSDTTISSKVPYTFINFNFVDKCDKY